MVRSILIVSDRTTNRRIMIIRHKTTEYKILFGQNNVERLNIFNTKVVFHYFIDKLKLYKKCFENLIEMLRGT